MLTRFLKECILLYFTHGPPVFSILGARQRWVLRHRELAPVVGFKRHARLRTAAHRHATFLVNARSHPKQSPPGLSPHAQRTRTKMGGSRFTRTEGGWRVEERGVVKERSD